MPKEKNQTKTGYVTTQTLILAVCMAFTAGVLGGVALSVYKSSTTRLPQPKTTSAPNNAKMLTALETETQKNPNNVSAWTQLGNMYFDTKQYQKAIFAYEKSIALDPKNPNVITDLGVMYRRAGQPKKAIAAFERAIGVDPKHEIARFNKGIVLMHDLNDAAGAIKAWEGLVAVNPLAMAPNGQSVDQLIQHYKTNMKP